MTREELFRAVGEVREDQIEAAEMVKKQIHPWRRFAALAACLALIVTAAAVPHIKGEIQWTAIVKSFQPSIKDEPRTGGADSGGGAAVAGGLDGTDYHPTQPTHPDWSTGVEIGQLSGPGTGETMLGMSACLAWMSPEEIFAQDTAIFRGTVRELHYFIVEPDGGLMERYYTRALVEVTDPIRGDLTAGETYSLLWLGAKGYMSTSISGPLEDLEVGSDAIFMPARTDQVTGWKEGNGFFCYADLADYCVNEGQRYVFADTAEGLRFDRSTYEALAEAETLYDIAAYIREQIGAQEPPRRAVIGEGIHPEPDGYAEGTEQIQPALEHPVPQVEPSETANADGSPRPGPSGALEELPAGARVSGE